jgi:hypothetical protein
MPPVLTTFFKENMKDYSKHICYNSYYIIINAGFHKKAEIMRRNFLAACKIDLKNESIKTDGKPK